MGIKGEREKIIGSSASGIYLNFIPPSSSSSQYIYSETWKWFLLIGTRVDAFYGCSQLNFLKKQIQSINGVCKIDFAYEIVLIWKIDRGEEWEFMIHRFYGKQLRWKNGFANSWGIFYSSMINFAFIPAMIFILLKKIIRPANTGV